MIVSSLKSYCQCFIWKHLMKLDLAMSTFFDINYLLFKIIEGFSQKGVQAFSGLACEWIIPEKIHTPTTEGMLENLTGEARVNSSGNLDCIHFSCYESLPKGYNQCIQPPLGLSGKIAPWQPSQNHLSVILVSPQRREPFIRVHSSG